MPLVLLGGLCEVEDYPICVSNAASLCSRGFCAAEGRDLCADASSCLPYVMGEGRTVLSVSVPGESEGLDDNYLELDLGDVVGEKPVSFDCEVRVFVAGGRPEPPLIKDCSEGAEAFLQWDSNGIALTVEVLSNAPIRVERFVLSSSYNPPRECSSLRL